MVLASAGFPPGLVHDGGAFMELPADGPPLGILAEAVYGEQRVELGKRALYLFSDGATDVRDDAERRTVRPSNCSTVRRLNNATLRTGPFWRENGPVRS